MFFLIFVKKYISIIIRFAENKKYFFVSFIDFLSHDFYTIGDEKTNPS